MTTDPADADKGAALLDEGLRNLGLVTSWSAQMEYTLRNAFCSLVGSKYAAVVAGGQSTDWLITNCRDILKVHREIAPDRRDAVLAALSECEKANKRRRTLVHGMKTGASASDGQIHTILSQWGKHVYKMEPWLPSQIYEAAAALLQASIALFHAMEQAVDSQTMVISDLLAWEEAQARKAAAAGANGP
jgi:hypothetical protein